MKLEFVCDKQNTQEPLVISAIFLVFKNTEFAEITNFFSKNTFTYQTHNYTFPHF